MRERQGHGLATVFTGFLWIFHTAWQGPLSQGWALWLKAGNLPLCPTPTLGTLAPSSPARWAPSSLPTHLAHWPPSLPFLPGVTHFPKTNGSFFLPIYHCSQAHPLAAAPPSCPQPHRPCSGTESIDQRPICRLSHPGSPDSGRQSCCWPGQPEAKGEMKLPCPGLGPRPGPRLGAGGWRGQGKPSPVRGCTLGSSRAKWKASFTGQACKGSHTPSTYRPAPIWMCKAGQGADQNVEGPPLLNPALPRLLHRPQIPGQTELGPFPHLDPPLGFSPVTPWPGCIH